MKKCPRCKQEKPLAAFQKNRKAPDGLQYHCRLCRKEIDSRPEKRASDRARRIAYPDAAKDRELKARYGISLNRFRDMLTEQGGRCAICRSEEPGSKKGWHVDHDHKTERVRGVLCSPCNVMLGHAKDDPKRLQMAAGYLARFA